MPCWYYDKGDLLKTPSARHGISEEVEARYRREGARLIMDTGTKLGLRFDTCATGVVYFHRFYMFHSFQDFHRYVTAACCLFLAGKVEETPKKCRDIIKMARSKLPEPHCQIFSDDSREEVMTLERILLQTIKFDLQVEHPYAYLLKFSKLIKGEKSKIEKMVQMAWTFINDSLCTTLSLQWEPDVIAVALMYLASRLTKFDIQDWNGKVLGSKNKWWDHLVEDVNIEFLEDICHQVLDLYSASSQAKEDSPPPPPPPLPPPSQSSSSKRSRPTTPQEMAKAPPAKMPKVEEKNAKGTPHSSHLTPHGTPGAPTSSSAYNPYVSTQMYSSSFMSQEGAQSIQSILGGRSSASASAYPQQTQAAPKTDNYYQYQQQYSGSYTQPPSQQPPPPQQPQQGYNQQYPYPSNAQYSGSSYSQQYSQPQQPQSQYSSYSNSNYQQRNPPTGNGAMLPSRQNSRRR